MEPLIRLGAPAVELLRAQQSLEAKVETKALWEVPIATITGQEDDELVRGLLAGTKAQQALACEIIVGATSKNWLHELEEIQPRDGSESKAQWAIAICNRDEGIPVLQRAVTINPNAYVAKEALRDLEELTGENPPNRMWQYRVP